MTIYIKMHCVRVEMKVKVICIRDPHSQTQPKRYTHPVVVCYMCCCVSSPGLQLWAPDKSLDAQALALLKEHHPKINVVL